MERVEEAVVSTIGLLRQLLLLLETLQLFREGLRGNAVGTHRRVLAKGELILALGKMVEL